MKSFFLVAIILYYIVVNVLEFFLMKHDKQCAKNHQRRIPEATLFGTAALGGAIGGQVAMSVYRHKTQNTLFFLGFKALIAVHVVLLIGFFVTLRL